MPFTHSKAIYYSSRAPAAIHSCADTHHDKLWIKHKRWCYDQNMSVNHGRDHIMSTHTQDSFTLVPTTAPTPNTQPTDSFAWRAAKATVETTVQVAGTTAHYTKTAATWLLGTAAWVAGSFIVAKAVDTAADAIIPYPSNNGPSASKIVGSAALAGTGVYFLGATTAVMNPLAFLVFMTPAARHIAYPIIREVAIQAVWGSLFFIGGVLYHRHNTTNTIATPTNTTVTPSALSAGLLTSPTKKSRIEVIDDEVDEITQRPERRSVMDID